MQRKAIQRQEKKANDKDEIKIWMAQELEVLMATIEANYSLEKLMQDRASLMRQLDQFKKRNNSSEEELATITEFIELRNAQIADLQQKILESDQGMILEERFLKDQKLSLHLYRLKIKKILIINYMFSDKNINIVRFILFSKI